MKPLFRLNAFLFVVCLFFISTVSAQTNLLVNGDLETVEPNFWEKVNEGGGGSTLSWDLTSGYDSVRAF